MFVNDKKTIERERENGKQQSPLEKNSSDVGVPDIGALIFV
jgi:hypothetical protein